MKMRILMISNSSPSAQFPYSAVFIRNLVNQLIEEGHYVNWVKITEDKKIYKLIKIIKYIYLYIKSIIFSLTDRYDLVHIHYVSHTGMLGFIIKKLKRTPLIINFHGSDIKNNLMIPMQMIISNADLLVSPSSIFMDKLHSTYEINIPTCIYPSGGIDCIKFDDYNFKKNDDELHIGYISRITECKGIWDFIHAVEKIDIEGKKIIAHIIGTGSDYDNVIDYINKSIHEKVNYVFQIYGAVPQDELPKIYNKFNVFIFPTSIENESLGLVALEAMACGVPVIATDIPISELYIKDGINGFIYKKGDVDHLVQSIKKYIIMDTIQVNQLKINAREMALKFETVKVTKMLISDYYKVLGVL